LLAHRIVHVGAESLHIDLGEREAGVGVVAEMGDRRRVGADAQHQCFAAFGDRCHGPDNRAETTIEHRQVIDVDESIGDRDAGFWLALVVLRDDLQLAAIDATFGVDVLDRPLGGLKLVFAKVGEGTGQRIGQAEFDRLLARRRGVRG
jgi:hypothetical protein